jgi:hypothetical protein
VWDSLYALFFITTSINTLIYYSQKGSISDSFTDLATAVALTVRAIIGIKTCKLGFLREKIKVYFITRLVWDAALLLLNIVMASLRKMSTQTFIFNIAVLLLIDGYLNLIIFSHLR